MYSWNLQFIGRWVREGLHRRFSRDFADGYNPDPRQSIPELPTYVSSLRKNLLTEYTGEVAFPEILKWINKKNVFNGKLVVATGGTIALS